MNCSSDELRTNTIPSDQFVFSSNWTRFGQNPILNPRQITSPSSNTLTMGHMADPCIMWDEPNNVWRIFWSLWDVNNETTGTGPTTGIVGATSSDGQSFDVIPNVALEASTFATESIETCDMVMFADSSSSTGYTYHLYYSASSTPADFGNFKIGLATSEDGINFTHLDASLSKNNIAGLLFSIDDIFLVAISMVIL